MSDGSIGQRAGLAGTVLGQSLGTLLGGGSLMAVGSLMDVIDTVPDTEAAVICALGGSAMATLGHRVWRTQQRDGRGSPQSNAREEWDEFLSERAELTRARRPPEG